MVRLGADHDAAHARLPRDREPRLLLDEFTIEPLAGKEIDCDEPDAPDPDGDADADADGDADLDADSDGDTDVDADGDSGSGDDGAPDEGGGCGCRLSGPSGAVITAMVALALSALILRRRQRG